MSVCLKKETLLAFADREMTSGEMESAEKHLAACAACQQELAVIRATSLKVNALLSSFSPDGATDTQQTAVVYIPYKVANPGLRWVTVASVSALAIALTLFVMIRRTHTVAPPELANTIASAPAIAVEKKDVVVAMVPKHAHLSGAKTGAKVRQFQALDDGAPIETGMIYRVSLPATTSPDATATQSAKRIPAEVIVDEFGKVRAIRFLQ